MNSEILFRFQVAQASTISPMRVESHTDGKLIRWLSSKNKTNILKLHKGIQLGAKAMHSELNLPLSQNYAQYTE